MGCGLVNTLAELVSPEQETKKMMKKLDRLLIPVLLLSIVPQALASEITLKNGDRVSGKIVEQSDESVTLETEYAGKITIARKHIEKIADGTIAAVQKPGPSASAEPQAVKQAPSPAKPAAALKPAARLFGGRHMGLFDGWEGNANIGFSFTSGNSNYTTMATGLRAVKTGGRDNLTIYARSLWNSNRGGGRMVTTQNAFWGGARYDRNVGRKLFGFVSYDFERDRPKKLNFRSVAGGGLGRHSIKNETTELDLIVGAAWNRTWQVGSNTDTPEALAGATFKHRFHEKLRYQNTITYFQNVTDRAEYRLIFDSTLSVDVTKRIGVFITVGDRFNNDPFGTSRKNDFLFTTGMKWNFGKKR